MEILLYSKCIKQLDIKKSYTSSEIFELEFIKALSHLECKVTIVSEQAIKKEYDNVSNIKLFQIKKKRNISNNVLEILKEENVFNDNKMEKVILMFGYDYLNLLSLNKVSKLFSAKLVSFTFDTHKPAIANKSFLKKKILEIYFKKGISKLNSIDGIILFNKAALKELTITIPYHISRVGISVNDIQDFVYKRDVKKIFKILYTGSLEKHNKILEMIEAISKLPSKDICFDIYGDGTDRELIETLVKSDSRINYYGLVSALEVEKITKNYDLLVSLRDPNDYVQKFAFPSKLIKYMASGIPILTTKLLNDKAFDLSTNVINNLKIETIQEKIEHILRNPKEQQEKAQSAKKYVIDEFLWDDIIADLIYFLKKI